MEKIEKSISDTGINEAAPSELGNFTLMWNYDEPKESEHRFRELLMVTDETTNLDIYLQTLTQIARAQALQQDFADANMTLNEVRKKLTLTTSTAEILYHLERGRVYDLSEQKKEALELYQITFAKSEKRGPLIIAVESAYLISKLEPDVRRQKLWLQKAYSYIQDSKETKHQTWLANICNSLGWLNLELGHFDECHRNFQQALLYRQMLGKAKNIRIAVWCVARALRALRRFDESLQILHELEAEYQKTGAVDGYVYEELGEIYLATQNDEKKNQYFKLAYQELSKDIYLMNNEISRMERIKDLIN